MKAKRFLAVLLTVVMLIGMLPASVFAYFERGTSLDVSAEGKTYSLFFDDYGYDELLGTTFLYIAERDGRYYTMCNPRYTEKTQVDSVSAIDITEYYNADTNTFSGIEDSVNIGIMQLQRDAYTGQYGMYLDGDMVIGLSIPDVIMEGWLIDGIFKEGIQYYPAESYQGDNRPVWQERADGSCYLFDWKTYNSTWTCGVLDLKLTDSGYVFAMHNKTEEFAELVEATDSLDVAVSGVTGCLYAAPCGHEQEADYAAYDAPTCMEKGCEEYWYCRLCETYFSDKEMTKAYEAFPAIHALGHDWDSEKCNNCGRPVPVYSKVTNKADFFALAEDTMYVLVAEYEGKYYTPDIGKINLYYYDRDGDGYADIYNVDENRNGTPDILEIDWDENGVYDYLEDCETEEERKDYFEMLCNQYLTDLIYGQAVSLPVKEITLNADGTISHDAVKDALEFEMIKLHTQEDIDQYIEDGMTEDILRYTYECVMQFVIPNTFIGSPCFIPSDRRYGQRVQDPQFDTYYWSVLFYNDKESYPAQDWETGEYSNTLEFLDICKEGSLALCKSWSYFSPSSETNCLRMRDYNGELSFVVGDNYALEGSEYVNDDAGGYYDTHDKQACVYLYASIPYQASHTCDFGDWVDDVVTDTHTRTCKDPECGKTETKPHDWDEGVQNGTPTCTEGASVTYTCTSCDKTKTETSNSLDHDWSEWTDDGEDSPTDTHSRTCKRDGCDAVESESHGWSRWVKIDDKTHKKSCLVCEGTRTAAHNLDDGVVTKEATHLETGVKTFTCTDLCGYYYTEDIPKTAEHQWGEWLNNNNNGTHTRYCRCGATETKDCTYDAGVVTTRPTYDATGTMTYTCTACDGTKVEILDKLVKTDEIVSADNSEIKITVAEGSNAELYENTVLKVEEVKNEVDEDVKTNVQVVAGNDNAEILLSYDISLLLNGVAVQPGGKVEVTLPALENVDDYETLRVVYIDDDGNVTPCETRVNADGTITFVTDHFSRYAIIGVHNSSSEATPTEYDILDGANGSWTQNSDGSLSFIGSGAFSDFVCVKVDGILVDAKNYTVKEGSTIVTLNADYLNTLTAGSHTLGIVWTDGSASTAFTVNAKAVVDNDTKSPHTGDNSMMTLWIAVLFVSGFGVVTTAVYGKKRKSVK